MPRNGAGQYSPTAGIPVVSGTTISSTAFNNVIDDLGDEITASLPVSGVAPMTGVLRIIAGSASVPGLAITSDTNTGIYSPGADQFGIATGGIAAVTFSATQTTAWSAKAVGKAFDVDGITDVASATTTDIGAAATSEVRITGTTTITGFGTSNAGIRRRGRFDNTLTLTHNGTSLILPGAANITTAVNDSFEALSLGSGNWIVTQYQRYAAAPGSRILIASGAGGPVPTIDLTLPSGYTSYTLEANRMRPSTDAAQLLMRVSTDNGSSYISSGYVYTWSAGTSISTTPINANQTSLGIDSAYFLFSATSNSTLWGNSIRVEIIPPAFGTSDTVTMCHGITGYTASGGGAAVNAYLFGGVVADPPTNIRLIFTSGNIADYRYKLYGTI